MNDLVNIANKELIDTYKKIKPTEQDYQSRLDWYKFIEKEIIKLYPETKLTLFGSFYTGLFTKSSDIDISLNINTTNPNSILRNLKNQLYKTKLVNNLIHLSHAKIPILKFRIKKLGFKFDISINNESGVLAAIYVKNIVNENEHLKIFVILFKHFITSRKLGDASVGGLNSYSQYLMIYNYFLMHPLINSLSIQTNLSVLFFDFIQFYGYTFKYKNVQIDCKNILYKPNINKRLSIIDPTDSSVDVGACCKNMDIVVDSLQNFYRTILYHFENNTVELIFKEMFNINIEVDKFIKKIPKKFKSKNLRDINLYKNILEEQNDVQSEENLKSNKKGKKGKKVKNLKKKFEMTEKKWIEDFDNEQNNIIVNKASIDEKDKTIYKKNKLKDKKDKSIKKNYNEKKDKFTDNKDKSTKKKNNEKKYKSTDNQDKHNNNLTDNKYNILPDNKYNNVIDNKYNYVTDNKYNYVTDNKYNNLTDNKYNKLTDNKHNNVTDNKYNKLTDNKHNKLTDKKENLKKRYKKNKSNNNNLIDTNNHIKKTKNTQIYDNFVTDLKCESTLIEEDIKHKKKKIKQKKDIK